MGIQEYADLAELRAGADEAVGRGSQGLAERMRVELDGLCAEFCDLAYNEGLEPYGLGYLQRGRQQPRWHELGTGWYLGEIATGLSTFDGLGVTTKAQPVRVDDERREDGLRYSKPIGWTGVVAVGIHSSVSLERFQCLGGETDLIGAVRFFERWVDHVERTFGEALHRFRSRR